MATGGKTKKKKKLVSGKDKLGKVKSKNKLAPSTSKTKKKKKKKLAEQEEVLSKKKKVVGKVRPVDEDDILDEDEDFDGVTVDDDEDLDAADSDSDSDDEDDSEDEDDHANVLHSLGKVDPGPEIEEVPCGFNCGSCTKFVKLDDPQRKDPEWLTSQISKKSKHRCPFLFPDEIEVPDNKSLGDYVMRADSKACDHFDFNEARGSEDLIHALNITRSKLNRDEIDVISHSVDRIRGLKADEDKHGYQLGEQMRIRFKTKDGEVNVKCEVVDFQRKKGEEVIVRPLAKTKGVPSRLAIAARRAVVVG